MYLPPILSSSPSFNTGFPNPSLLPLLFLGLVGTGATPPTAAPPPPVPPHDPQLIRFSIVSLAYSCVRSCNACDSMAKIGTSAAPFPSTLLPLLALLLALLTAVDWAPYA